MLTPGIEYFAASSDAEAEEFAEGRAATTPRLVRGDGVAPDGLLAVLGALLTGRAIDELAADAELEVLTLEERDDGTVTLVRLPGALSDAFAAASEAELAEVARRALVFDELRGADPALIAAFLGEVAELVRNGGRLYARVIADVEPRDDATGIWHRLRRDVLRALPWLGLVAAVSLAVTAFALRAAHPGSLALGLLPVAGILTSFSVGALIRRRSARRLIAVLEASRPGSIGVTVDADAAFLARLPSIVSDVLGEVEIPTNVSKGVLHLVGHPGGLDLVFGDGRVIAIPAHRVLAIDAVPLRVVPAAFGANEAVGGFAIALRIDDAESVLWEVATFDTLGGRLAPSQLTGIAEAWALLVGAWYPGRSSLTPDSALDAE